MNDSFYLAWQYVIYNKLKTLVLVGCITTIAFLPIALQLLLAQSQKLLVSRAASTPLIVGAKGSALDLVMNTLYFDDEIPQLISMQEAERIQESELAYAIPIYVRFRARKSPIVATTLDYFDFRGLQIAKGLQMQVLGECVLGAKAAQTLNLKPGDSIVSSPENLFDLAGVYPLKMKISGVLEPAQTSDDEAVFIDLKTAWIIEGLGHGHQDLQKAGDDVILKKDQRVVTANASLVQYTEITPQNIDSFHFHGDSEIYPTTAVLAVPYDQKSATILQGRYLSDEYEHQIVRPKLVVDGLLQEIFRIKNVIDGVISIVAITTVLAIVLIFSLSLRLRRREIQTIFKLGCSRATVAQLLSAEIVIIILLSTATCIILLGITNLYADELAGILVIR